MPTTNLDSKKCFYENVFLFRVAIFKRNLASLPQIAVLKKLNKEIQYSYIQDWLFVYDEQEKNCAKVEFCNS